MSVINNIGDGEYYQNNKRCDARDVLDCIEQEEKEYNEKLANGEEPNPEYEHGLNEAAYYGILGDGGGGLYYTDPQTRGSNVNNASEGSIRNSIFLNTDIVGCINEIQNCIFNTRSVSNDVDSTNMVLPDSIIQKQIPDLNSITPESIPYLLKKFEK